MHIVYLIKVNREKLPNKYIGSKSNCYLCEGKIYDQRNKEYFGSSKDKEYKKIVECCDYTVQVLATFDEYTECLAAERDAQIKNDVVASPEYFNKSIATFNTYTNPDYATYKHVLTGKTARLPRNHDKVLSGEWVGTTKGTKYTLEERQKRGRSGEKNSFFCKKHSEETKRNIGKKIGDAHRGKPKSNEQRRKMAEARKLWWAKRKENNKSRQEESI